jgi:tetratricopeptide (TPR) repeat protein
MMLELAEKSDDASEKRGYFEKALYLFQLLGNQIDKYRKGQSTTPPYGINLDDFWKTPWRLAKCNAALDKFDDALRAYEALLQEERLKNFGFLYEEKASVHVQYGDALWDKERKKAIEQYENARKIYGQLIMKVDPIAEPPPPKEALRAYWISNLAYIRLYVKLNEIQRAMDRIKQMKHLYPDLDQNEFGFKEAVDKLEKEIGTRLPKKKKP